MRVIAEKDPIVIQGVKYRVVEAGEHGVITLRQGLGRKPRWRLVCDDETAFNWDTLAGLWRWNGVGRFGAMT